MKNTINSLIVAAALSALSVFADAQSFQRILERPVNIVRSEWEYDNDGNQELTKIIVTIIFIGLMMTPII